MTEFSWFETIHQMSVGDDGEVFAPELLKTKMITGVMHSEMHYVPGMIHGAFGLCNVKNRGVKTCRKLYKSALGSQSMHISYQQYTECMFQINLAIIPTLQLQVCLIVPLCLNTQLWCFQQEGWDGIAPLWRICMGL